MHKYYIQVNHEQPLLLTDISTIDDARSHIINAYSDVDNITIIEEEWSLLNCNKYSVNNDSPTWRITNVHFFHHPEKSMIFGLTDEHGYEYLGITDILSSGWYVLGVNDVSKDEYHFRPLLRNKISDKTRQSALSLWAKEMIYGDRRILNTPRGSIA